MYQYCFLFTLKLLGMHKSWVWKFFVENQASSMPRLIIKQHFCYLFIYNKRNCFIMQIFIMININNISWKHNIVVIHTLTITYLVHWSRKVRTQCDYILLKWMGWMLDQTSKLSQFYPIVTMICHIKVEL